MATKAICDITGEVITGKDFGTSPITLALAAVAGEAPIEAKIQFFQNNRPGINLSADGLTQAMTKLQAELPAFIAAGTNAPTGTPSKSETRAPGRVPNEVAGAGGKVFSKPATAGPSAVGSAGSVAAAAKAAPVAPAAPAAAPVPATPAQGAAPAVTPAS